MHASAGSGVLRSSAFTTAAHVECVVDAYSARIVILRHIASILAARYRVSILVCFGLPWRIHVGSLFGRPRYRRLGLVRMLHSNGTLSARSKLNLRHAQYFGLVRATRRSRQGLAVSASLRFGPARCRQLGRVKIRRRRAAICETVLALRPKQIFGHY